MKQPHICLDETLGVRYAVLPGDPARLDRVAVQLENVRELAYNREFRSLTGTYRGPPRSAWKSFIISASPPPSASAPAARCRRASASAI